MANKELMPQLPYFEGESQDVRVAKYFEKHAFSIKEAARFFERTTVWLRWVVHDKEMLFRKDGSRITIPREGSGESRLFNLETIRDIAQILYSKGRISKAHYNLVARRVNAFHYVNEEEQEEK